MAGHADFAAEAACVFRGFIAVEIAECAVDRQNRDFGLDLHRNGQPVAGKRRIAGVIDAGKSEIEDEAQRFGRERTVIAIHGQRVQKPKSTFRP